MSTTDLNTNVVHFHLPTVNRVLGNIFKTPSKQLHTPPGLATEDFFFPLFSVDVGFSGNVLLTVEGLLVVAGWRFLLAFNADCR